MTRPTPAPLATNISTNSRFCLKYWKSVQNFAKSFCKLFSWQMGTTNPEQVKNIYLRKNIQMCEHTVAQTLFFCRFTNLNLNLCKDVSYYNVLQKETYFLQKKFACCFRTKTFFVKCFWKSLASCCVFLHPCAKFLQRGSITAWPNMILEVSLTQPDAAPSRSP